jgi:hypothetical protein
MRSGALDLPLTNGSHSLRACAFVVFKSVSSSRRESVLIVVGVGSRRGQTQRPVTPTCPGSHTDHGARQRSLSQATMSTILKYSRSARVPISRHARALAMPAASGSPVPKKSSFTDTLADGPSLDDFVSDNVTERIVLGNKNTYAVTFFPPNRTQPDCTHTLHPVLACLPT